MATFKVGQRVRIVRHIHESSVPATTQASDAVGREATISGVSTHPSFDWEIEVDGLPWPRCSAWAKSGELAPLTDPKADAFIEQIKRLNPEPESVPLPARVKA